jgi:hypothetical protein
MTAVRERARNGDLALAEAACDVGAPAEVAQAAPRRDGRTS